MIVESRKDEAAIDRSVDKRNTKHYKRLLVVGQRACAQGGEVPLRFSRREDKRVAGERRDRGNIMHQTKRFARVSSYFTRIGPTTKSIIAATSTIARAQKSVLVSKGSTLWLRVSLLDPPTLGVGGEAGEVPGFCSCV